MVNHETMKPRISFVVPVYNKANTLVQSIQSIRDQTISDWEIVAVSDASTDQSEQILSMLKEPRLKKVFLPSNVGVVKAYQEGVKRAKGKYVIFHDPDDLSLPDRAEKCLAAIGDADVLYHGLYVFSKNPSLPIMSRRYMPAEKWDKDRIFTEQYIPGVICAKRKTLLEVRIPEDAWGMWDWMFHILLHQAGAKYQHLDNGLYEYIRFVNNSLSHGNDLSGKRLASIKWIQNYLVKNKLVKPGHKFGKGFTEKTASHNRPPVAE